MLEEKAWQRFKAPDSSIAEKAASLLVTTAMRAKSKFGGGIKQKKKNKKNQSSDMKGLFEETTRSWTLPASVSENRWKFKETS